MARPQIRWVAPDSKSLTLRGALDRLGVPASRITEGAVFLNGRRACQAHADQLLAQADVVEVFARLGAEAAGCRILARRGSLLVVDKPAALASEPTQHGTTSAAEELRALLGGAVHVHSRLDVGVGGLMLVATSRRGNAHVAELRRRHQLTRKYLAIGFGRLERLAGNWHSKLHKGRRPVDATTRYRVLGALGSASDAAGLIALELEPLTGRTHQLRIQCAAAGAPLVGDSRYGGPVRLALGDGSVLPVERIMLHAVTLALVDERGQPWQVAAELPSELDDLWRRQGGSSAALEAVIQPGAAS